LLKLPEVEMSDPKISELVEVARMAGLKFARALDAAELEAAGSEFYRSLDAIKAATSPPAQAEPSSQEPAECIGTQIAKDEFAKRWDEAYQRKFDQDVTPEYLQWLQDSAPREGVGGNVAWNAGVAWARATTSPQDSASVAGSELAAEWGYAKTVGNAIAQLRTFDPATPFFAAFHLEGHAVARGVTFSRERVVDARWIGERYSGGNWIKADRDEVPYSIVVWSMPEPTQATTVAAAPDTLRAGLTDDPENDDGAAFRLAVKLGVEMHIDGPHHRKGGQTADMMQTAVSFDGWMDWARFQHGRDPCAATRKAIVAAAREAALRTGTAPAAPGEHRIADARNKYVKGGYVCIDCGALFRAADHDGAPAAREVELPELPDGDEACLFTRTSIVYTADQMRAYATTALQSAASGREDSAMLDWLLSHPNEVFEEAGNEWFVLDADSTPTYFKSGRDAIDAAMNTTKGAEQ
jgi:hypothetical protein